MPETKEIQSLNPFFGSEILKVRFFRRVIFIPYINRQTIIQEFIRQM